nr:NADH dehydrogenase subunit 6 [Stenocorus meridianus]
MFIFIILINFLSILFLFLNHPLSFGMILLLQTILISLLTGMLTFNYWFSYMLFLIMIGGMLILFIYMTSIASNEKFKFSFKLLIFSSLMLSVTIMIILIDNYFLNLNFFDLKNQNMNLNFYISMKKFLNSPSNKIMYMIIIYLLISLIMTTKITDIQYGPLRQKL